MEYMHVGVESCCRGDKGCLFSRVDKRMWGDCRMRREWSIKTLMFIFMTWILVLLLFLRIFWNISVKKNSLSVILV